MNTVAALSPDLREALLTAAQCAAAHSYSPYSGLTVGAAVLTAAGAIYRGCNVENASFGLTLCAERNAICQAVAQGNRDFLALAVYAPGTTPIYPCGACRQVLAEFSPDALILCGNDAGQVVECRLSELLPGPSLVNKLQSDRQEQPND